MTKKEKIKLIQVALNAAETTPELKEDGAWGPLSQAAFDAIVHGLKPDDQVHPVIASSFADDEDIAKFKACKAKGKTDNQCFKVGDNGEGEWGDATARGSGPSCALPPETMIETWGSVNAARGRKVAVQANGTGVTCRVLDTMPLRKNITNGAGIDLNPDACKTLGLVPPVMARATWQAV